MSIKKVFTPSKSKKQSQKNLGKQQLFYTEDFKLKIVNEVLSGKLNKHQAQQIYGIKGNATILYWIRQSQGLKGYEKIEMPIANFAAMRQNINDKKLQQENEELKELLRVAELRADLWQHTIELAEKRFGIDIKKKVRTQTINSFQSQRPAEKITEMCTIMGYTKQAYYAQLKEDNKAQIQEDIVLHLIKQERTQCAKISGRSLHKCLEKDLEEYGITIGRDKFFELLRNNGLLVKPWRNKARTTDSFHHYHKFDNLVPYQHICTRANEIWVSDITYVWLEQDRKFCYLSLITDMYSRKIVGYCVHNDLSVNGCLEALEMALMQRKNKAEKLIHHSDRGVQYCCKAYVKKLKRNKINISMTQTGDPKENAIAERINRTIKCDFSTDGQIHYEDVASAKIGIKKIVNYYNNRKPHSSVEGLTPSEAHQRKGQLKRKWKTYYKKQKVA